MFCIFSIPELPGSQPGQVENVYSRGRASHPPAVPQIQRDEASHPAAHPAGALREERGHEGEAAGAHDEADEQQQHQQGGGGGGDQTIKSVSQQPLISAAPNLPSLLPPLTFVFPIQN